MAQIGSNLKHPKSMPQCRNDSYSGHQIASVVQGKSQHCNNSEKEPRKMAVICWVCGIPVLNTPKKTRKCTAGMKIKHLSITTTEAVEKKI